MKRALELSPKLAVLCLTVVVLKIRKEAMRQVGGFPKDELRRQLIGHWGREFAHQLFGPPEAPAPQSLAGGRNSYSG